MQQTCLFLNQLLYHFRKIRRIQVAVKEMISTVQTQMKIEEER